MKPVIHLSLAEFPGKIVVQESKTAKDEAQKDRSDLALWLDGPKLESRGAGAAVELKSPASQRWDVCKISLGENKEVLDAELWGISEALKIALRVDISEKARRVTVFSDSQAVIKPLQGSKSNVGQALKVQIHNRARQLQTRGREVIVRWIPSDRGIEGNERADKAAKEAATNGRTQTARWSSLSHVTRNMTEAKSLEICSWHQVRNGERERRSQSYYVPRIKP